MGLRELCPFARTNIHFGLWDVVPPLSNYAILHIVLNMHVHRPTTTVQE